MLYAKLDTAAYAHPLHLKYTDIATDFNIGLNYDDRYDTVRFVLTFLNTEAYTKFVHYLERFKQKLFVSAFRIGSDLEEICMKTVTVDLYPQNCMIEVEARSEDVIHVIR